MYISVYFKQSMWITWGSKLQEPPTEDISSLFWNPSGWTCKISFDFMVSPLFIVWISLYLHKYFWQKDKIFVSTCQPYFFPLIVHISAVHCSPRSLMMRPPIDTNAHTSQWKPIPAKTIQYQICIILQYQTKFARTLHKNINTIELSIVNVQIILWRRICQYVLFSG